MLTDAQLQEIATAADSQVERALEMVRGRIARGEPGALLDALAVALASPQRQAPPWLADALLDAYRRLYAPAPTGADPLGLDDLLGLPLVLGPGKRGAQRRRAIHHAQQLHRIATELRLADPGMGRTKAADLAREQYGAHLIDRDSARAAVARLDREQAEFSAAMRGVFRLSLRLSR